MRRRNFGLGRSRENLLGWIFGVGVGGLGIVVGTAMVLTSAVPSSALWTGALACSRPVPPRVQILLKRALGREGHTLPLCRRGRLVWGQLVGGLQHIRRAQPRWSCWRATRRAAEIGDRDWHALLDAHDAVVRAQLNRFRGREVNTSGDSFLAMFDGPQRAIRCAMAIRDAVHALGIEVRAGLHTGECEIRGDDIGGIAVHIGARVSALAGPNDVLVSSTLRDLVIGSGLEFEERGTHELKGVPGEWHLFAVAS